MADKATKSGGRKSARAARTSTPAPTSSATKAVRAQPEDPNAIPATAEEVHDVRTGKAKPDNTKPLPRPRTGAPETFAPARTVRAVESDTSEDVAARVVDITDANRKLKGFRVVEVVATRMGHYGLKRLRAGSVFTMGLVGDGYLPSWVKLANAEDKDPEVSRSRQVSSNSTGQEIRDDVARDAGTEVPTYLGGNQRRATSSSGDVL